jgi:hypothetical protein
VCGVCVCGVCVCVVCVCVGCVCGVCVWGYVTFVWGLCCVCWRVVVCVLRVFGVCVPHKQF